MTVKSALQVSVNLGVTPGSMARLSREIDKSVAGSLESASKKSSKAISKGIQQALDQGANASQLMGKSAWIRKLQKNLTNAMLASTDTFGKGLSKVQKAAAKEYGVQLLRSHRRVEDREKRSHERRKQAAEEIERFKKRSMEDHIEGYSRGVVGAHQSITGMDFGAAGGAVKGIGGGISRLGMGLQEESGKDGMFQKMGGSLGKVLAPMGKLITVVGAAVAGVALLVKSFLDVEAGIKDINKGFVEMGGAANLGLGTGEGAAHELNSKLRMLQDTLSSVEFSKQWYTSPEMVQQVMQGFSEGGQTIGRMTAGISDVSQQMRVLQDSTAVALTYSNLLGKSVGEMSTDMGKLSFETGSSLQLIAEGFTAIHQVAAQSGFEVKRFYSAVLESTTGMGMYNTRIDEAAGLLSTLSNVLGQTVGSDFAKSINISFSTASYKELIKEGVLAGEAALRKNLRKDAKQQSDRLVHALRGLGSDQVKLVRDMFGKDGMLSPDDLYKKLSSMSEKDFSQNASELRAKGVDQGFIDQLEKAFDTAAGGQGKRLGDAQRAQTGVSKLIQKLLQVENIFGGRRLDQVGDDKFQTELAAVEGTLSGVDVNTLRRVMQGVAADAANLTGKDSDPDVVKKLEKQYGVAVDNGKIFKGVQDDFGELDREATLQRGEQLKSFNDLLRQSSEFKEVAALQGDQVGEDIKLAREVSKNTNSMINVLKTGVSKYLQLIYRQVTNIWDWLWGQDEKKMARVQARAQIEAGSSEATRQRTAAKDNIENLQKALDTAATSEQRQDLQKRIRTEEKIVEHLDEMLHKSEQAQNKLSSTMKEFDSTAKALDFATGKKTANVFDPETLRTAAGSDNYHDFSRTSAGRGLKRRLGEEKAREIYKKAAKRRADVSGGASWGQDADFGKDAFVETIQEETKLARGVAGDLTRSGIKGQVDSIARGESLEGGGSKVGSSLASQSDSKLGRYLGSIPLMTKAYQTGVASDKETLQRWHQSIMSGDTELEQKLRNQLERGDQSAGVKQVDDFVISNGQVLRTNPQDTIMGAKGPGFAGGSIGGSSRGDVHVHINGGDTRQIYDTVKKALSGALK